MTNEISDLQRAAIDSLRSQGFIVQVFYPDDELTLTQTSDYLGVPLLHVVDAVERGELSVQVRGSRVRAVVKDVLDYQHARQEQRRALAKQATSEAAQLGLYDEVEGGEQ